MCAVLASEGAYSERKLKYPNGVISTRLYMNKSEQTSEEMVDACFIISVASMRVFVICGEMKASSVDGAMIL